MAENRVGTCYNSEGTSIVGYIIMCPGCDQDHLFDVKRWTFNGDLEKPTFSPSMLSKSVALPSVDPITGDYTRGPDGKYLLDSQGRINGSRDIVCHSFVRNGQIEYLSDCTHDLAGKTVPLEPFTEINPCL